MTIVLTIVDALMENARGWNQNFNNLFMTFLHICDWMYLGKKDKFEKYALQN